MLELTTYVNAVGATLGKWLAGVKSRRFWKVAAAGAAGFLLSAASLSNRATPVALGLLCAAPPGAYAAAIALGGCLGYWLFWGEAQAVAWMAAGLLAVVLAGDRPLVKQQAMLMPVIAAVVTSGCGVLFLLLGWDDSALSLFLMRVLVSSMATGVYRQWRAEPTGAAGWMAAGLGMLALAQFAPTPYLSAGYLAAGFVGVRCSFPVVAMAGLGLDLAQVTRLPMTGVLCLSFCLRLIPRPPKWLNWAAPAAACLAVSMICRRLDPHPLPGLILGGLASLYLPGGVLTEGTLRRRGKTGLAQVRLEKAAMTMQNMEHNLLLTTEPELDRRALLRQAADECCDTCPERKGCKARHLIAGLSVDILERPGLQTVDLPPGCRKNGRLLTQLRRAQEKLRRMKGDRRHRADCRAALEEQYGFLSEYLRDLSDNLVAAGNPRPNRFRPEIGIRSHSLGGTSGDRCEYFEGTGNLWYVLLCDGMGTGEGAAGESRRAIDLIRQFLQAGFSPAHALRSFNSLCALQSTGGCASIDLLEVDLRSGKGCLYKWGAGPSYRIADGRMGKIGTAGPPPGLSQQTRETADRLSLGGGEVLIMLSDGVGAEGFTRPQWTAPDLPPGELAAWILEQGVLGRDDATAAVVRLRSLGPGTQ